MLKFICEPCPSSMGSQDDLQRVSGKLTRRRRFGEQGLKGEVTVRQEQPPVCKEHGRDRMGCSLKKTPQNYGIFKRGFSVKMVTGNWLNVSYFEETNFIDPII